MRSSLALARPAFNIDALLQSQAGLQALVIDALLASGLITQAQLDALLQATGSVTTTLDAIISGEFQYQIA